MKIHTVQADEKNRLDLVCHRELGAWNERTARAVIDLNPLVNFTDLQPDTQVKIPSDRELFL